jgi:hypothetical protein
MELQERIQAFVKLGKYLRNTCATAHVAGSDEGAIGVLTEAEQMNPWFTRENQLLMLSEISKWLSEENLRTWLEPYRAALASTSNSKKLALVMAGNIPLAGFHDLLSVLLSGHSALIKLSSKDRRLLPWLSEVLISYEPRFGECITFVDGPLKGFDAVIATGSNESAQQFEKYFQQYPHIIRKNRTGLAVLNGKENTRSLELLCDDIFTYFGLGCRSITYLWVPRGYSFDALFSASEKYLHIADHHKYASNMSYQQTLLLMSGSKFLQNGVFILQKKETSGSPIGTIYYNEYDSPAEVRSFIEQRPEHFQCVVSDKGSFEGSLPFGSAQHPALWDHADGIDTMKFLTSLHMQ